MPDRFLSADIFDQLWVISGIIRRLMGQTNATRQCDYAFSEAAHLRKPSRQWRKAKQVQLADISDQLWAISGIISERDTWVHQRAIM